MNQKQSLYRDTDNRMLGGVASGLAEYMHWDVTIVRLAFLFSLFVIQGSVLAYILAWIIIPSKYNPNGGLSSGKFLLLVIFCFLPFLLFLAFLSFIFIPTILSIFAWI